MTPNPSMPAKSSMTPQPSMIAKSNMAPTPKDAPNVLSKTVSEKKVLQPSTQSAVQDEDYAKT